MNTTPLPLIAALLGLSLAVLPLPTHAGDAGGNVELKDLPVGSPFPDFNETDINGKPISVGNYKGKIVLVDFWATWCGPCVGELPNVLQTYQKYHDKGFEIVGVSLDSDKAKLTSFIQTRNMPWQQFFDGGGWHNKVAAKYVVHSIPATYLIDKDGKLLAKNLRGPALEQAVAAALGGK